MRQAGQDPEQVRFREILLRLRYAQVTIADWQYLMTRSSACISELDMEPYRNTLHLYPTIKVVTQTVQPIAKINAVHKGPNSAKARDDTGSLEPVVYLAHNARVMLVSNLWVENGLVNGFMGTVQAIVTLLEVHHLFLLLSWSVLILMLVQHLLMVLFLLFPLDVNGQVVVNPAPDYRFLLN